MLRRSVNLYNQCVCVCVCVCAYAWCVYVYENTDLAHLGTPDRGLQRQVQFALVQQVRVDVLQLPLPVP